MLTRTPQGDDEVDRFLQHNSEDKVEKKTRRPSAETDLEQGRLLDEGDETEDVTSFPNMNDGSAVIEQGVSTRCRCCCAAFGFFIRALFAFAVFVLAVFVFVLIMQAAWRTYRDAGRNSNRAGSLARKDAFAQAFPFCATRKRNRYGFVRNACWAPKSETDEVDKFAILFSRSMIDQPETKLGKRLFLIDAMFNSGSEKDGEQLSMSHMPAIETDFNIFRLDPSPDSLFCDIRKQSTSFRARDELTAESIEQSVGWSGWMTSLEVLKADDDEVWIDATDLLKSLFYIVSLPSAGASVMMRDSIRVTQCDVFPSNVNIAIQISSRPLLDKSASPATWTITFSLTLLSEKPAVAREMHDSVGYFTSAFRLIGSSSSPLRPNFLDETTVRIINRRRNFVYYIDPSVPPRWRSAVKRGVESWNLAFESFKSPIRLRAISPGDPDWPTDYSAADVRYSSISWSITLDRVFALGPSTVDPRSGEILNSDIVLSHGWIRTWFDDLDMLYDDEVLGSMASAKTRNMRYSCSKRVSAVRRLLPANLTDEQFVDMVEAGLADVVSHEVGHTLGLRHNFVGSLQVPIDKLKDKEYLDKYGLTSSVMDYVPLNPMFSTSRYAFPLRIGSYDIKAIQYGYDESVQVEDVISLFDGTTIQMSSNSNLNDIALAAGEFTTDEDDVSVETGWNPESSAFDLSADPLGYAKILLDQVRTLRAGVLRDHTPNRVDAAQRILTGEIVFAAKLTCKFIGGRTVHNRGRKMTGITVQSVDGQKQVDALGVVLRVLTSSSAEGYFPYTSWVKMGGFCQPGAPQQACYGVQEVNARNHTETAKLKVLHTLLSAGRIERLESNQGATLTVQRFFDMTIDSIFGNVGNTDLWTLQTAWIKSMQGLVANESSAVSQRIVAYAQAALQRVNDLLRKTEKGDTQDKALMAHVGLCLQLLNPD